MHDTYGLAERYMQDEKLLEMRANAVWTFLILSIVNMLVVCALIVKHELVVAMIFGVVAEWLILRNLCKMVEGR